jgi:hypothetical protein
VLVFLLDISSLHFLYWHSSRMSAKLLQHSSIFSRLTENVRGSRTSKEQGQQKFPPASQGNVPEAIRQSRELLRAIARRALAGILTAKSRGGTSLVRAVWFNQPVRIRNGCEASKQIERSKSNGN